jgi:hypothetical protein
MRYEFKSEHIIVPDSTSHLPNYRDLGIFGIPVIDMSADGSITNINQRAAIGPHQTHNRGLVQDALAGESFILDFHEEVQMIVAEENRDGAYWIYNTPCDNRPQDFQYIPEDERLFLQALRRAHLVSIKNAEPLYSVSEYLISPAQIKEISMDEEGPYSIRFKGGYNEIPCLIETEQDLIAKLGEELFFRLATYEDAFDFGHPVA